MINPPDELLADLQSALPPDAPVTNGGSGGHSSFRPPSLPEGHTVVRENGEDHMYELADQDDPEGVAGYELPRSSTERSLSPEVRVVQWDL